MIGPVKAWPIPPTEFKDLKAANAYIRTLYAALAENSASLSASIGEAATTVTPHVLVSTSHTASGLTAGHFLKATAATTFAFGAHGLAYGDVGAAASGHNHSGVYDPTGTASGLIGSHEGTYTHANIAHGETAYGYVDQSVKMAASPSFAAGTIPVLYGKTQAINDDASFSFTPAADAGFVMVNDPAHWGPNCMAYYIVAVGYANIVSVYSGSDIALTTGVLSGTTGADAKLTISAHTDGKIYIENRIGGAITIRYMTLNN